MGLTKPSGWLGDRRWRLGQDGGWRVAFLLLPFLSYASLALLILLSLRALVQHRGRLLGWLWQQGYGWLSLGLVASGAIALHPGDAFLQTTNFLPYFLMLGALVVGYGRYPVAERTAKLAGLTRALVLASLPFSLLAGIEYAVKFPALAARVEDWAIFRWAFEVSYHGHRAAATLGHPNILSAYLVIIVSLGLGLIGDRVTQQLPPPPATAVATAAGLGGIFCTGSRNGVLIVLVELGLVAYWWQRSRIAQLVGLGGAIALVAGIFSLGVGGRTLNLALMTQDPRVGVWQIALGLIQQRPLLGWGLGSFSQLYVPNSVPGYPHIHHAHNLWLYLASELGIPMMLGFCWVVGLPLYRALHRLLAQELPSQQRSLLTSYLLAFGSCMLFGLFDVPLFDARINALGWLMLAGIYLCQPRQAEAHPSVCAEHSPRAC